MFMSSPFLYSMYILIIGSTTLTILSPNWMTAWMMLEINMLTFLPIICMSKSNQETEAATKYFLVQALGSLLLLTASVMLYQPRMTLFMLITFMTALLLKLGAFPCHFWYPSMMSSISWSNCLILSTWQKIAPLTLISTISSIGASKTLLFFAGMNALTGGFMGLNQTHLRSLLAYSSISHLGWMLSMIAMNHTYIWIFYFSTYCLIVTPVFLAMMMINAKTIYDLYSLFKIHYLMPAMLMLLMLSLAGVPPLTGFLPKLMVISSMTYNNYFILFMLLLGSYMNLYYYLNVALAAVSSSSNYPSTKTTPLNPMPILIMAATSLIGLAIMLIYALITLN